MKQPWFNRTKFGFFPASTIGWILSVGTALFCIYLFFEIHKESNSLGNTIVSWLINVAVINIVFSILAYLTSSKK